MPGTFDGSLVRVWSSDGDSLGKIGLATRYDDALFDLAMNDGAVALSDDTLWYARLADGRIFGFDIRTPLAMRPRTIELPLYYEMIPPEHSDAAVQAEDETGFLGVDIQRHTLAFALDEGGNFLIVQSTGSGTVLAALSRDGGTYRAFDIGGMIRAVSVADGVVYAIVSSRSPNSPLSPWRVFAYQSPFTPGTLAASCRRGRGSR